MKRFPLVIYVVVCFLLPWAHGTEIQTKTDQVITLERPGDPPAPASVIEALTEDKAGIRVIRNEYLSVQVNVNANGNNTRGDAANEPSIAVDPTAPNRMVIGWRQFDSLNSNHREAGVAWSNDGGRTWTNPGSLTDGIFRSDPVLECDADGHFFYNSLSLPGGRLQGDFFDSEDGGQTWAGPDGAFGGDKVWVTIDTTNGIGRGNIYQTWSTASNQWGDRVFSRSTDGGRSFSAPQTLLPPPIWGSLAVGPQGELYLGGKAGSASNVFVLWRSIDAQDPNTDRPTFRFFFASLGGHQGTGGESFETPNPAGLLGQVWLAADTSDGPNSGALYMLSSVDPPGSDPQDVHFIRSADRGETWSRHIRVNNDDRDAWQWFGTMSVAPNGRIDVVWIESLTNTEPSIGEIYYSYSSDGGLTWSNASAVTPTFDSHLGFPQQDKMGDYFHMRSDLVGADLAYAATFNGEQDVFFLRIGDRDCDGNGVGDTQDLSMGDLKDCDGNTIPDLCEVAARPDLDLNNNHHLDACEPPPRQGAGRSG